MKDNFIKFSKSKPQYKLTINLKQPRGEKKTSGTAGMDERHMADNSMAVRQLRNRKESQNVAKAQEIS